jgi:hypothetical protein
VAEALSLFHIGAEEPSKHLFSELKVIFCSEERAMHSSADVLKEKVRSHFVEAETCNFNIVGFGLFDIDEVVPRVEGTAI